MDKLLYGNWGKNCQTPIFFNCNKDFKTLILGLTVNLQKHYITLLNKKLKSFCKFLSDWIDFEAAGRSIINVWHNSLTKWLYVLKICKLVVNNSTK